MRKFFQRYFSKRVIRLSSKFGSRPVAARVHGALTELYSRINAEERKKGLVINLTKEDKIIILSDQHKGAKDFADDFAIAENNYLAALNYYNDRNFTYINLGDSEELWENLLESIIQNNTVSFEMEKAFRLRKSFIKIFGNHDLYWDNDPLASFNLKRIYGENLPVYEGAILRYDLGSFGKLDIFLTHGHQGDTQSDGNWFSKWFVSTIWAPLQAYLMINPNTPAFDVELKSLHNKLMYEWTLNQKNVALITGHTHQPVFASLTILEHLYRRLNEAKLNNDLETAKKIETDVRLRMRKGDIPLDFSIYKPTYFNTGCCCFSDGDITGIEIADGKITLIKWEYDQDGKPKRFSLEEMPLDNLVTEKSI